MIYKEENYIKLTLDNEILEKYYKYYFFKHPKAKKKPIEHPYHPSINTWMIMKRPQMNALKQKWKDLICIWLKMEGVTGMMLENFEMVFTTFMPTRRRIDCDNTVPKFILDGMSECGFIVDDDGKHLRSLTLKTGYDKENPRTEIEVFIKEDVPETLENKNKLD